MIFEEDFDIPRGGPITLRFDLVARQNTLEFIIFVWDKFVAIRTLHDKVLCNNNFVSFQAISDSHSTGTEVLHPRRKRNLERVINLLSSRYGALLPNTLEGDNSNGAKRGAPPAAKLAIEALETFEVGSTSSEEGERMAVLCAVCKDVMVINADACCSRILNSNFSGFVVSDSDDCRMGTSIDSTAPGSLPVEALHGEVCSSSSKFPERLFAWKSYPTTLRLNIYSKANVIGTIASCPQGSADMAFCFGLSLAGCLSCLSLISTTLPNSLAASSTVSLSRFANSSFGSPSLVIFFRFSLDEFPFVTGLNCRAFNVEDSETDEAPGSTMWNQLFDTTQDDNCELRS
ncbi:hypothetical protein Bca52824_013886 [Brassica carinata]|uniref:Uncharacterized protein n=1 Tax=Brassica carinata TaxID=52824 RepID=A0A8X7VYX7_BRACI|nr:hypothetical protein Bca52824_013886 [Brassica carinata]